MSRLYIIFLTLFLLYGCYDDKGNYDYKSLDSLSITLPSKTYSCLFGEKLQISPTIETTIPETDLIYEWEFYGKDGDNYWSRYFPVYRGKELDYTCFYNDTLLPGEGTYSLRLNVTQNSTGRHFYSETVSVKLDFQLSHIGAMVLHGDGISSDIGIVVADEFQIVKPESSAAPEVYPHFYSNANAGEKIDGRGQWIIQNCTKSSYRYPENIFVIAVTDKEAVLAHSKSLLNNGSWNDLFNGGLNQGKPENVVINSMSFMAFDDGDVFKKTSTEVLFAVPLYAAADHEYDFDPRILPFSHHTYRDILRALLFDRAKRGFVAVIGSAGLNSFNKFLALDATVGAGSVNAPFNPGDMNADLVHMDLGGLGDHVLAVMKNDDGEYFMVEMDVSVKTAPETPKFKYDLMHVEDVKNNRVIDWAFGSTFMNMCYFATPEGVYRFTVDNGKTIQPEPLMTANNAKVQFEGNITMMKILKPDIFSGNNNDVYYKSNVEMVVGTYGGTSGSGILYSIELDPLSGRVLSVREYTGFDEIYDVNIKGY